MKYFGTSVAHALKKMLHSKSEGRVLVTLPSFPAPFMLDIAQRLEILAAEENISLQCKFAQAAVNAWSDTAAQRLAKERGWADEKGNLTAYRNEIPSSKKGLVVLGGIHHILDTASLEDFVLCDDTYIWQCEMEESFQSWLAPIIDKVSTFDDSKRDFAKLETLLKPLRTLPTGGLLAISKWLEQLDFSHCSHSEDIADVMLKNLDCFALPNCIGFARKGKSSSNLNTYLNFASSFFDYESFMSASKRKKACDAIDAFRILCEQEDPKTMAVVEHGEEFFPEYDGVDAFLDDLSLYISERNTEAKERLRKCDIVTIKDRILRTSRKESSSGDAPKEKTSSLHGPLIENVLNAIWETCGAWRKTRIPADADIASISLQGETYSYAKDEINEDGVARAAEARDLAYGQLSQLIVGVDDLIMQRLEDLRNLDDEAVTIESSLLSDELEFQAVNKAPRLRFSIILTSTHEEYPSFTRYFEWIIPERNEERLNAELLSQAYENISGQYDFLPMYHLSYYDEILTSTDERDTREIIRHSLKNTTKALPLAVNIAPKCEDAVLRTSLSQLTGAYSRFLKTATEHSIYYALFHEEKGQTKSQEVHDSFCNVLNYATERTAKGTCDFSHIFMRAFLVTQKHDNVNYQNLESFEPSGIVTILHPALLEQLEARIVFLFSSFIYAYKNCLESKEKSFAIPLWRRYVSLAAMQMPLFGLLKDANHIPTTKVRGHGCIHKIGEVVRNTPHTLSTRLYSADEKQEERISEKQLFQLSAESSLLENFLRQYFSLRSQAWDGISLAVFRNQNIQPVIAGVHAYLRWLNDEKNVQEGKEGQNSYALHAERKHLYDVRIVFFTDSRDATDLRAWLSLWQDCWENALSDTVTANTTCYRHCKLSISHRFSKDVEGMRNVISAEDFDVDISILYGVTGFENAASSFVKVASFDATGSALKFPILEKKYSPSRSDIEKLQRSRIVSHRQFRIASAHAQLLYSMSKKENAESILLTSKGDFSPKRAVISKLHEKSEWVICIDSAIDEDLIQLSANEEKARNIIAFGSGVGTHGEANYTISTEQLSFADVQGHLEKSIESLYAGYGVSKNYQQMVVNLLSVEGLSGMGLIKATSLNDLFIHDFFAAALTRRFLCAKKENIFCDLIVSLDAYKHWFNFLDDRLRPDLFWITGEEKNGELNLCVRIVECKLGKRNSSVVKKAYAQIQNGITVLKPYFQPRPKDSIDDERPDRRYWWNQLHRIVTSRLQAKDSAEAQKQVELLEKLAEGIFQIEWEALLLTYWTDCDDKDVKYINSWNVDNVISRHFEVGREYQLALANGDENVSVIWDDFIKTVPLTENFNFKESYVDDACIASQVESDGFDDFFEDYNEREDWEKDNIPFSIVNMEEKEKAKQELEELVADFSPSKSINEEESVCAAVENILTVDSSGNNEEISSLSEVSSDNNHETIETAILPEAEYDGIPERILLGKTKDGKEVYWEFKNATNRHLLIFGCSGNGKTYAIQCILAELARAGVSPLVVDYSQSFAPEEIQKAVSKYFPLDNQRLVAKYPLPINPFQPQNYTIGDEELVEGAYQVAGRVTAILKNIYNLGTQQINVLTKAIMKGIDNENELFNLDSLVLTLESFIGDERYQKNSVRSVLEHMENFSYSKPFASTNSLGDVVGWSSIFSINSARNTVFQLANINPRISLAIIEFVLWDLFAHVQRNKFDRSPKVVVLDEIQNLSLDVDSPVGKYLKEGRKFGLALIAATQSFSEVKYASRTLEQAATKLYFRPADSELSEAGRLFNGIDSSRTALEWRTFLAQLGKGECFLIGDKSSSGRSVIRKIKITAMEDRCFES